MITRNDLNSCPTELLPPDDGICPMCGKYRGVNRKQWTLYPDWYSCKYCFISGMSDKEQRTRFIEEQKLKMTLASEKTRDVVGVKVDSIIAMLNTLKEVMAGVRIELVELKDGYTALNKEVRALIESIEVEQKNYLDSEDVATILEFPPMERLRQTDFIKDWVNRRLLIEPSQLPRKWREKRGRPLVGCELRARCPNLEWSMAHNHWEGFLDPVYYLFPNTVISICSAIWEALDNDPAKKDRFVSQLSVRLALPPGPADDKIVEAQKYASPVFVQLAASYLSAPLTLTAQDKEELGW